MRDNVMPDWSKYESAEKRFVTLSIKIAKQLKQLQEWQDDAFGIKDEESINWAHVGSIANISETLDYALEWKQQQDEKNDK